VIVPRDWKQGDSRVVVGVSGSPDSIRALQWAVDQARFRDFTVEAVTAFNPLGDVLGAKAHAATLLADSLAQVNTAGTSIIVLELEGHPSEVLLSQARGADLLVVGTRGLGRLREALTGSVTHTCAEHSPVPVAIVRGYPPSDD
jgi:nucleotide-binding universal stress UspA family protein